MPKALAHIELHLEGLLHSYSQIMFAKSKWIGLALLVVSFIYPTVGVCGVLCGLGTNLMAKLLNQDSELLKEGVWGFGAVMVGLFLGHQFQFSGRLFLLVALASFLYLVLTVGFYGLFSKSRLPFLTLPFIITVWVLYYFSFSVKGLYLNEFYSSPLTAASHQLSTPIDIWLGNHISSIYVLTFLKTLAGIFFNSSLFAGVVIFICMLFFSRIATVMMIVGFSSAFLVYKAFGLPITQLTVNLAGANYIFFAIAMAGFYLVGNIWSLLMTVALTPILTGFVFFFNGLLYYVGLSSYTLAFVVTVQAFLYFLSRKTSQGKLLPIWRQLNQHESNLYSYLNGLDRYKNSLYVRFGLPFLGEWWVSQSYNGAQTHLGAWRFALDFIILDDEGKSFASHGTTVEDYYCFNKPVLAPAAGYVTFIQDNIKDNVIGQVNLENNWGNSIIIKHAESLFTQISHLKMNSFKVWTGQYVNKGDIIGYCGNSGRSAEPHVHFQVQASAVLGAYTIQYPLAYYFNKKRELASFQVPEAYSAVSNADTNPLLDSALGLIPGKKLKVHYKGKVHYWEVFTDALNRTYLHSYTDKATCYFVYDGSQFFGVSFNGPKDSPLKHFYMACYRVFTGFESNLQLTDSLPVNLIGNRLINTLQDFLAPLVIFNRAHYAINYRFADAIFKTQKITLEASLTQKLLTFQVLKIDYSLHFADCNLKQITIKSNNVQHELLCENY